MSNLERPRYTRPQAGVLRARLAEPRRFVQVVAGPRQVGKTTLVRQGLAGFGARSLYASADEPALKDRAWIALDEIQQIAAWPETVKRLWDEDTASRTPLRVVLLGSAPLLVRQGLD